MIAKRGMSYRKFFALFVLLFLVTSAEALPLQKYEVKNAAARQAVCNDGSPSIYYFREGKGSGANTWVIFLVGGGFCFSVESCDQRLTMNPELMTSRGYPETLKVQGILSDSPKSNPDFYNANHVVIPYCSSDLWSGDRESSTETGGYEFRGRRIVQSVVSDLQSKSVGGGISSAQSVLLCGTSAGGTGVMIHLDWLATKLPRAQVRGLNDAGWIPESLPDIPGYPSLNGFVQSAIRLWNGKPDVSCAQANPGNRHLCYLSTVYPYLKTPLLLQESQYDSWVLGILQITYPFDDFEQIFADLFASNVRESLIPVEAAFSPRTWSHGLLPYASFNSLKVNGVSLRQVLGNWFFDRSGPVKLVQQQ
jgi:O-palmitoleoyl-L-serine hydrolase